MIKSEISYGIHHETDCLRPVLGTGESLSDDLVLNFRGRFDVAAE